MEKLIKGLPVKEYKRQYRLNNPERIKEIEKKSRLNNKEKIKERNKKWQRDHRKERNKYQVDRHSKNPEKYREYIRNYMRGYNLRKKLEEQNNKTKE